MRRILFLLLVLGLTGCGVDNVKEAAEYNFNIESVNRALDIATKISNHQTVDDAEWDALFDSPGYGAYFCAFNKEESIPLLKSAFKIVFDDNNAALLDSLLKEPVNMGPQARFNLVVKNWDSLKKNREQLELFVANTDFTTVLKKAKQLAQGYLPAEIAEGDVELYDVNFNLMEPNAYVTDCGLVVDIYSAFDMGEEELAKTIGHEFHHNYRNQYFSIGDDVVMRNINDLQQEGIADLIDKPAPPVEEMSGYPQAIVDAYNEMFANTPQILRKLDSLTTEMLSGAIDKDTYDGMTNRYFIDGGHANGYYMSLKIKEAGLTDRLIETYDQPTAYIKLYNEAVENAASEYQFSATFISYIEQLQKEHLEELANASDEAFEVTFMVQVPDAKNEVFIVGNKPELADWDPGQVKLEEGGTPESRMITLSISSPVEFKFTRGSWATEGIMKGAKGNQNLKLKFDRDTVIRYEIAGWVDAQN